MKYRVFAAIILGFLVFNLGGSSFADTKVKKTAAGQLVALLPASDGVATFDVKRSFSETLPQVLAGNQSLLAKITGHIDEVQAKIGIDPRQFDEMVVGVSVRHVGEKKYDIHPVAIARGQMGSAALISAARSSSKVTHREERVGNRVMYVFDHKVAVGAKAASGVSMGEIAVASLDDKTIAFGDVARVRLTLEAKTRVATVLTEMLGRSPAAVASFAAKTPAGLKAYLPLENDELGKNIDSIRYVYGNADVASGTATLRVTARTQQNAQAASLLETLNGLQMLGKAFLGGAQSGNRVVYKRLVESAKFSTRANEVMIDLVVPQSDLEVLVGALK